MFCNRCSCPRPRSAARLASLLENATPWCVVCLPQAQDRGTCSFHKEITGIDTTGKSCLVQILPLASKVLGALRFDHGPDGSAETRTEGGCSGRAKLASGTSEVQSLGNLVFQPVFGTRL